MESDFEIVNWDRYFALYENGNLLCVTVYKKGAAEVKRRLEELKAQLADALKENSQNQDQKEAKNVE